MNKKEIEKAIILRDGKPSVILLDFDFYEKIMSEYLLFKNKNSTGYKSTLIEKKIEESEIKEIEKNKEANKESDFVFNSDYSKNKTEPLKEFWD